MSLEESDMLDTAPASGYSAAVQIELFVNGQRFSVAQCGRGLLIFDKPLVLPGTEGELVLTVDGHPRRWLVDLPNPGIPTRIVHASLRDVN